MKTHSTIIGYSSNGPSALPIYSRDSSEQSIELSTGQGEIWKRIGDTHYEVSSFGRVRNAKRSRLLTPHKNTRGYFHVTIFGKSKMVHRLVAEAFCERADGKNLVCHRDGDQTNNLCSNLYWGDTRDNIEDAFRHGTINRRYKKERQIFRPAFFDKDGGQLPIDTVDGIKSASTLPDEVVAKALNLSIVTVRKIRTPARSISNAINSAVCAAPLC